MVHMLAMFGQVFLIFAFPAILFGEMEIAIVPLILLMFSPTFSALLQLALARTREFEADRVGAMLVGEVDGLVSALAKLERHRMGLLRTILNMPWKLSSHPLLRTHPPTKDRKI